MVSEANWVSLDPRKGEVVFYPTAIAERIEAAFSTGLREVELLDGRDATVIFDGPDKDCHIFFQVTPPEHLFTVKPPGYRNVTRIESLPTTLFARRIIGEWRLCRSASIAERTLQVTDFPNHPI